MVLADLGRSPRMQNHALAIAGLDCDVVLLGFRGTAVSEAIAGHPHIAQLRLHGFEGLRSRGTVGRFAFAAAIRQIAIAVQLAWALLIRAGRPDLVLLQTPPMFPALPIVLAIASLRGGGVILDWHNTTAAMLQLRLRSLQRTNRLAGWLSRRVQSAELAFGRGIRHHLCVSEALRVQLQASSIEAAVLPDLPTAPFRPLDRTARDGFVARHRGVFDRGGASASIVLSPSAWTIDDDFDLLIEALRIWDAALVARGEKALRALFVLTGVGERRLEVEGVLAATPFVCIALRTAWFEPDDYPLALATADLGLSLHRSANGADVPIKLAELLGCGVPLCALDSAGVRERIEDGVNGVLFSTAAGLAAALDALLGTFPDAPALGRLRAAVGAHPPEPWESCWNRLARPLFERLTAGNRP